MLGDVQYSFWFNPTLFRSWLKWSTHVPLDHIFNVKKKKKTTTEDCVTFRSQTVRKLTPIPSNVTTGCSGNYSLPLYRNYIIEQWVVDSLVKGRTVSDTASIHIYAFSRHFYPERLTLRKS